MATAFKQANCSLPLVPSLPITYTQPTVLVSVVIPPNVTFEFVTFATKKKFVFSYFNFTLIPFWKLQPLDL